jgi:hypothetical protein
MNAGVARTDDARKIHPFDVFHSEVMIKGYIDVGVQVCCAQDRQRPLTRSPEGAKT